MNDPQDTILQDATEALNQAQDEGEAVTIDAADDLKALAQERDDWKDKAMRVAAELENFKKRTEVDIQNAKDSTLKHFALDLLNTADNLTRAQEAVMNVEETDQTRPLKEGFAMVFSALEATLTKHGIKKIESIGHPTNPDHHQVMQQAPSDQPEGEIIQELQPGYVLGEKLLRPALVITSNGQKPN